MISSLVRFAAALSLLASVFGGAVAWAADSGEQHMNQIEAASRARLQHGRQPEGLLRNMLQRREQNRDQLQDQAGHPSTLRWQHQHQNCLFDPAACPNPDPPGEQYQHKPQPEQPGPGELGGNPECPNCDPAGEQHQHGGGGRSGNP